MNRAIKYWLLRKFYDAIRPLFVYDVDPNEDYTCCWCNKPVLKRVLYCSEECSIKGEENGS